jgi:phospholipase C
MKTCATRSFSWITSPLMLAFAFPLLLVVTGCGGGSTASTGGGGKSAVPTIAVTANPASVVAGTSSTLTVAATNASTVTVSGSDGTSYTLQGTGGTQQVSPKATTTYTAQATGTGGTASGTAVVTVTAATPPPAPTVTLTSNPFTITAGSASTLTVAATNATSVVVTGTDGSSYKLAASGGTQSVSPASTAIYTATVTGAGGTVTATATVVVTPAGPPPVPTVKISAAPTSIVAGATSTLSVTALNATTVTVSGSDGTSYTLTAIGGTQSVNPTATTTYTAKATGAGGSVTATAVVTVTPAPAPTVTMTATPKSIIAGSSSTLAVAATNATTVAVTGSDGSIYSLSATGGTQTVSPATTTTYTAKATGAGGNVTATAVITVTPPPLPTVKITANPTAVVTGNSSTLTVVATNATAVTVTGSDSSSYTLFATGGTQSVSPTATTTYTANATGAGGNTSATATVTVNPPGIESINHVVFMLQENHTFDNYFGMLNPYRAANGWDVGDDGNTYMVDGIDDKLKTITNQDDAGDVFPLFKFKSTCIDDDSSDWLASFGAVNRWNATTSRKIKMDGFVHISEGYASSCALSGTCSGDYTDTNGQRAMGYYDQDFLNYYYYMASQFAVSDRWFSPIASKSTPNRIATYSGGTTQGLVYDPGYNDHLGGITAPGIFWALDKANVSWKVYYSLTNAQCSDPEDCAIGGAGSYPATDLGYLYYNDKYLYPNPKHLACTGTTVPSSTVGDTSNYYCVDPNHVAPISQYYTDVASGTLPAFSFIEAGYGLNDEHPGSFQPVLLGQAWVANIINALMNSPSWKDSVFFFSYDEGGGPYDHVPPVPGHSNDLTSKSLGTIPDIASIAVSPDTYPPCVPTGGVVTQHCDLRASDPGAHPGDAAQVSGFGAQIGFRVPNFVVSPFARRHYVSHIPMDHTAIMKFVENRFIGPTAHLTARDAAQPDLLDFFDFSGVPWSTPPTPPVPVTNATLGYNSCQPGTMGP